MTCFRPASFSFPTETEMASPRELNPISDKPSYETIKSASVNDLYMITNAFCGKEAAKIIKGKYLGVLFMFSRPISNGVSYPHIIAHKILEDGNIRNKTYFTLTFIIY